MRRLLPILTLIFPLLVLSSLASASLPSEPINAIMHERKFVLSDYYYIDSANGSYGNVIKNKVRLTTNYHYYDPQGNHTASAYPRILSLGAFFTWAGEIDLYDANGKWLGLIEGSMMTLLPSKFSFYNDKSQLIGTGYMDADCLGVTILDPNTETKTLAHLRRIFVKDVTDHWTLSISNPNDIDPRFIYLFAAFALDNQGDFREDN